MIDSITFYLEHFGIIHIESSNFKAYGMMYHNACFWSQFDNTQFR